GSDRHRRTLVDDRILAILVTTSSYNGRLRGAAHRVKAERKAPSIRGYAFSADEEKYPHEPLMPEVGHFRKSPLLTLRSAVQPRTDIADRAALQHASINAG